MHSDFLDTSESSDQSRSRRFIRHWIVLDLSPWMPDMLNDVFVTGLPGLVPVLGKITYIMISNQKSKSHPKKWFKIKITCTKNQNHKDNATFSTQHLCAKIQRNYAVILCAKNAYGHSVLSNMFQMIVCSILCMVFNFVKSI